ncbi:MAG: galactose-1-phosphate uridylyltransferase [Candidatus Margulisiibacteriota bacterium]|nr:MAG: galactose-1-phosphate uridylyltransferase [Candidatus Margulisbacteria bacterium GWD2_39_127]OGI04562.1 MAG: galactose-1-phosphate uridylyltransferase [Candidatus Margulisbacteria bacterium GWF2_38_17]OGI11905.1 MAG: galactose-1-phosphate uridylyltransferase [Candidatus Margulisbacteria bacterium GWE2_39_32]PZM83081.1 MAG: galactose-1-phosphate uridylyltransferase [Candidatus Margulisiibacteriota bacterium]HAR62252.1 galactose-1-phosphate uridylyltransferase [Candidatus Margulisiibacter
MPELRKDPVIGRWVIIAKERGRRPSDFKASSEHRDVHLCPFCEGNEDKTPPEILSYRSDPGAPNTSGWKVRAIPNKFPVLEIEGDIHRAGVGMYDMMNGIGAHEVIVESPKHVVNFIDLSGDQIELILKAYRERLKDLYKDKRFRYIIISKNYGLAAGAILSHSHSQLIAMPIVPRTVRSELKAAKQYYLNKERCVFCDMMKQELSSGERIIATNDHFVVLAPFASRFPFEMCLMPKKHSHRFHDITDEEIGSLASILIKVMSKLKSILGDPAYNIMVHTAPNELPRLGHPEYWSSLSHDYHWHFEIMPRLIEVAGFEWGTGLYINSIAPEDAALHLREGMNV